MTVSLKYIINIILYIYISSEIQAIEQTRRLASLTIIHFHYSCTTTLHTYLDSWPDQTHLSILTAQDLKRFSNTKSRVRAACSRNIIYTWMYTVHDSATIVIYILP